MLFHRTKTLIFWFKVKYVSTSVDLDKDLLSDSWKTHWNLRWQSCLMFIDPPPGLIKVNLINCLGSLLLTWSNFNPSTDKNSCAQSNVRWNYLSIPSLHFDVWEWTNNFISHFIIDVINNPCWNRLLRHRRCRKDGSIFHFHDDVMTVTSWKCFKHCWSVLPKAH